MVETNYNTVFGVIGLLVIPVFGGGSLIWLICSTPIICLPYLKFLTLFVVFIGGWLAYGIARFVLDDKFCGMQFVIVTKLCTIYFSFSNKIKFRIKSVFFGQKNYQQTALIVCNISYMLKV